MANLSSCYLRRLRASASAIVRCPCSIPIINFLVYLAPPANSPHILGPQKKYHLGDFQQGISGLGRYDLGVETLETM